MVGLTKELKSKYDADGFVTIPSFLSENELNDMKQEAQKLLNAFDPTDHPKTMFSTEESGKGHVGDRYFLESEDKIRYFLEEEAVDANGKLLVPNDKAINKIGHGLHVLNPVFSAVSLSSSIKEIANTLGFKDPLVLQSMLIFKQPRIGGSVPSHQDSSFLYTDPPSAVGFWFALEDCTIYNGCLEFVPGSHKTAPITKRFVTKEDGSGTMFIDISKEPAPVVDNSEFHTVEVKAGSLVIIHGSVIHRSAPNRSEKSRHIYTFHMIEGAYSYDEKNWLQPRTKPFTKLFA
ncbi:hypothetical protein H4219_000653 [Mycoemilia scoparia]|uniref:Phytanoyl-CoA dioxygenase n=1 Tax=Mycoemilia scoparia TaxID=417184 RepID=A0A9W8A8H3_9FUNG|nr:hypothetical protein H4219_000653 [Mycoemilia scoparia]